MELGVRSTIIQLVLLLAVLQTRFVTVLCASEHRDIDWEAYERGALGLYPQTRYHSNKDVSAPLIHVTKAPEICDYSSYTLLSPRGEGIPGNKAYLLDGRGDPVWIHQELGAINDFRVQRYKGQDFITYWMGDDEYPGHGHGYYKMLDQTYTLAYTISGVNGADGDFHEFSITMNDTALITAYVKTPWDLSSIGRKDGYIWDCVFQEINIETNGIIFEWRASNHFTFNDMSVNSWEEWVGSNENPWDWFHINSVEKDPLGNYLLTARNTNAVTYINGRTGNPMWHLGGDNNAFTSGSTEGPIQFVDPFMARWTDDYTGITLFDNTESLFPHQAGIKSRGLKLKLNGAKWAATVAAEFVHPDQIFAFFGGSLQILENGNYFLGYGSASIYSEFAPNGTLLSNAHFSPMYTGKDMSFRPGFVQSYRVYQHSWVGHPRELPKTVFSESHLYVSWNGATEVWSWRLAGKRFIETGTNSWHYIGTFKKDGFETGIPISRTSYTSYKLTAIDSKGRSIGSWDVHPEGDIRELLCDCNRSSFGIASTHLLGAFLVIFCCGLLVAINRRFIVDVYLSRGLRCTRRVSRRHGGSISKAKAHDRKPFLSDWGGGK